MPIRPARTPRIALTCTPLDERCVPAVLTVDDSGGKQFTSIAAAVAAAHPKDTIKVYAGTYQEQLHIPAADTGLTLTAAEPGVIVQSPAVVVPDTVVGFNLGGAILDIRATKVTVSGFNFDGSTNTDGNLYSGIRVVEGGSATIKNNAITGLTTTSDLNFGIAIEVGTRRGTGSVGTATIQGNRITSYIGAGVVVDGTGSSATVKGNTVVGRGADNGTVAENGIQISFGATGQIVGNRVSQNSATNQSAGLLISQTPGNLNVIKNNILDLNEVGAWFYQSGGTTSHPATVVGNTVTHSDFAGILIDTSDNMTVQNNSVSTSIVNGIASLTSTGGLITNNRTFDNGSDGIYLFSSAAPAGSTVNNVVKNNKSTGNWGNGIFLEQSSDNQVLNNQCTGNVLSGIEVLGGSNNVLKNNSLSGNAGDGVTVQNATVTTVTGNRIKQNAGYGLRLSTTGNTAVTHNTFTSSQNGSGLVSADSTGVTLTGNKMDTPFVFE
jgi:parallel beta-helix repeat protein